MLIDKCFALPFHEGDLGLELEVESSKELPIIADNMWSTKNEGSLRGHGREYVTHGSLWNNPRKRKEIDKLISKLPLEHITKDCPRTSLHVHVNVQKYNINHLYAAICAYWMFENILVKFSGEELREGNHFCLRLQDAEWVMKQAVKDLQNESHFLSFAANRNYRYSALNLAAIPKFGSIEFRSMRGTCDPNLIDMWSSELHYMCAFAKKHFPNPSDLMDKYFSMGKVEFMQHFFSKQFMQELMKIKHWKDLITEQEGLVCELAYARDWKLPFKKLIEPTKKKKQSTDAMLQRAHQILNTRPRRRPQFNNLAEVPLDGGVFDNHGILSNYNRRAITYVYRGNVWNIPARMALNTADGMHMALANIANDPFPDGQMGDGREPEADAFVMDELARWEARQIDPPQDLDDWRL